MEIKVVISVPKCRLGESIFCMENKLTLLSRFAWTNASVVYGAKMLREIGGHV